MLVPRLVATLLLAALLTTAGCGAIGPSGADEPQSTLTPAPVPDDTAAENTPTRPRVLRTPLEPWTLADAHAETLAGRNYTWVLSRNQTSYWDFPNTERETVYVVRVANATTYRVDRRVRVHSGTSDDVADWRVATTEYAAGGAVAERRSADRDWSTNESIRVRPVERPRNGEGVIADRAEAVVARYLDANRMTVRRAAENGTTLYVVKGQGAPPELPTATNQSVTDYRVTALVRPDGRVLSLYARWIENSRTLVAVRSRYRAVGNTSVTAPAWAANASVIGAAEPTAAQSERGDRNASEAGGWVGWPAWASDD